MSILPPRSGPRRPTEEPPPFLGSWRRVYAAVILWLAVLIVAFYVFTRSYAS